MEQNPPRQWDLESLRRRSGLLLGSRHRLPVLVLAATLPPEELYAARVAARAQVARRDAGRILGDLVAADLLERGKKLAGARGRPGDGLQRVDDEVWAQLIDLARPYER